MVDKFLIIAATHGDEKLGVDVMKKIEKELSLRKYKYDWIIGNPKAYEQNIRFLDADLNRVAPGNSKSKIYEEKRAAEIMEISLKYKFILDIHSTISDSGIVTIIPYPTLENIYLASTLNIKRNVIWYSGASLDKGPIVQFADCPGVEIECGPKTNPKLRIQLCKVLKKFIQKSRPQSISEIIDRIKSKEFYVVYGKEEDEHNDKVKDFKVVKNDREVYYPFLSNQYAGVLCYKTKKFDIKQYLLYDS